MADVPRDCIFCKIARHDAPAGVVAEDDAVIAFLDIRPINPGHTLIVPKRHATTLGEMPRATGGRVFETAMAVAAALRRSGLPCEGVNLHLADGAAAGQEVPHVHFHVIPRFAGDGHRLRFGPGYGAALTAKERDETAAKVRTALRRSDST